MAFRRHLNRDEIASILDNENDYSPHNTDSEQEDCGKIEDDIANTYKFGKRALTSRWVVTFPQRSISGKNNHICSTRKERLSYILYIQIEYPIECVHIFDPLLFQLWSKATSLIKS